MNIERLSARTLYGIEIRTSNQSPRDMAELWERFRTEDIADDVPERADDRLIAAYHSYEGDHTDDYTYFLGCEVIDVACVPDGFALREIPSGDYAVFRAQGAMSGDLIDTWQQIRDSDLRRTYGVDFEIYDPGTPDEVEIFVGVH